MTESIEKVCEFLKNAGVYYLATCDGDKPKVRPFGTANIFDGKLYIQTGKKKPVAEQIKANPNAEICAFKDGDWIRIGCRLVLDDRREARKSMLDAYPELRSMYDEDDGNTEVYYLTDATAVIASFTKPPVKYTF